ncbi:Histone-Lysine N-Methyltransferase ash1l [Thoreauomyces humboldtii]|nr:Histone-Lysine N-Methyltransferase ash1l [Thoreauomyces humboldtii]
MGPTRSSKRPNQVILFSENTDPSTQAELRRSLRRSLPAGSVPNPVPTKHGKKKALGAVGTRRSLREISADLDDAPLSARVSAASSLQGSPVKSASLPRGSMVTEAHLAHVQDSIRKKKRSIQTSVPSEVVSLEEDALVVERTTRSRAASTDEASPEYVDVQKKRKSARLSGITAGFTSVEKEAHAVGRTSRSIVASADEASSDNRDVEVEKKRKSTRLSGLLAALERTSRSRVASADEGPFDDVELLMKRKSVYITGIPSEVHSLEESGMDDSSSDDTEVQKRRKSTRLSGISSDTILGDARSGLASRASRNTSPYKPEARRERESALLSGASSEHAENVPVSSTVYISVGPVPLIPSRKTRRQIRRFLNSPLPAIFSHSTGPKKDMGTLLLEYGVEKVNTDSTSKRKYKRRKTALELPPALCAWMERGRRRRLGKEAGDASVDAKMPRVTSRPPGAYARDAERNWAGESDELYARKDYLPGGMYSSILKYDTPFKQGRRELPAVPRNPDLPALPLPLYYGKTLMDTEVDFELPYDLMTFAEHGGGVKAIFSELAKKPPSQFTKISRNIFVDRKPQRAKEVAICHCETPEDGSAACLENCLNRCMMIECSPKHCPAQEACTNQRFRNRESVKDIRVVWTAGRGYGLQSTTPIIRNSLVLEYRGEIISQETCRDRMRDMYADEENYYFLNYDGSEVIDGCRKGTDARMVDGEYCVGLFSTSDIPADQELTYDYRFESFGPMQPCLCGARSCRARVVKPRKPKPPRPLTDRELAIARHWKQELRNRYANLLKHRGLYSGIGVFLPRNAVLGAPKVLITSPVGTGKGPGTVDGDGRRRRSGAVAKLHEGEVGDTPAKDEREGRRPRRTLEDVLEELTRVADEKMDSEDDDDDEEEDGLPLFVDAN